MEQSENQALEQKKLVRLPSPRISVALFVGLFVFAHLSTYILGSAFNVYLVSPFALTSYLAVVAFCVMVVVLNRPVAILIGIGLATTSEIARHYWVFRDADFSSQFPREPPDEVLVDAFLGSGVTFGLVGLATLISAKYLFSGNDGGQTDRSSPTLQLPSLRTCLSVFAALLLITALATYLPGGWFWTEIVGRGAAAAGVLVYVALFLAIFTIFRPWALLLPIAVYAEDIFIYLRGTNCLGSDVSIESCMRDFFQPTGFVSIAILLAFTATAFAARVWADQIPNELSDETKPTVTPAAPPSAPASSPLGP